MQRDEGLIALGPEVLAAKLEEAYASQARMGSQLAELQQRLNEALSRVNECAETIETLAMAIRTINALTLERARA